MSEQGGEVYVDGRLIGYIAIQRAEFSVDNLHKICPLWPPERLSELEQANHWRPVAENEVRAPRPSEGL